LRPPRKLPQAPAGLRRGSANNFRFFADGLKCHSFTSFFNVIFLLYRTFYRTSLMVIASNP
jgi:hypothetical protein